MRDLAQLLNAMRESGVIANYALFGATAQMRYTEPVATLDVDVLVSLPDAKGLDILRPIYEYCTARGYKAEGEAIRVGAWPVQFIPVFSSLTREALDHAETADYEGIPLRVVGAAHLAAIALSVGRGKDYARILSCSSRKPRPPRRSARSLHDTISMQHGFDSLGDFWMNELQKMLERQAIWQKSLRSLSWPEKIRMAEATRESIVRLRASAVGGGPDRAGK